MGRPSFREEGQFQDRILDVMTYDPPGMTWTEIAKRLKGIGTEALSKYLRKLVTLHIVLHEGKFYRRNPWSELSYDFYRHETGKESSDHAVFLNKHRLQTIYSWSVDEMDRIVDTMTTQDILTRINIAFCRSFVQYIRLLQEIVEIPNKTAAREYYEIASRAEIEPSLVHIAHHVWENRAKIRIRNVDPLEALRGFLTQWIDKE